MVSQENETEAKWDSLVGVEDMVDRNKSCVVGEIID